MQLNYIGLFLCKVALLSVPQMYLCVQGELLHKIEDYAAEVAPPRVLVGVGIPCW